MFCTLIRSTGGGMFLINGQPECGEIVLQRSTPLLTHIARSVYATARLTLRDSTAWALCLDTPDNLDEALKYWGAVSALVKVGQTEESIEEEAKRSPEMSGWYPYGEA